MSQHSSSNAEYRDDDEQRHPICTHCAGIIGVYEPVWIQLTDGSLRESSLLNLAKDAPLGQSITRIWHAGCLAADTIAFSHDT